MTRSWISRLFARSCAARQARSITRRRAKVWPTRFDLELLEDRNAPASFVEAGATLNLNLDTASESVSIQSNGTNYKLSLAATNWSGTDSANVTGNGSNTLTVTKAGIDAFTSGINIADSAAATSVTFATSGAKLYANAFNVVLGMGSNGVTFDGASNFDGESLVVKSDGPILVAAGAAVTTSDGGISLKATPKGAFDGIDVFGTVISTGNGQLILIGRGGVGADDLQGVRIGGGGKVTSGAASVSVTGTAGTGGDNEIGVFVTGANSTIASIDGDLTVSGAGGGSAADKNKNNDGVRVSAGGSIRSTGTGQVVVTGNSGLNTGKNNCGVSVLGTASVISSKDGSLQVTGISQAAAAAANQDNVGVFVDANGSITATATGPINIDGTGASDGGSRSQGIQLAGDVTSGGGDITLTGVGGTGSDNFGVALLNGAQVQSGLNGNIRIVADGVSIDNGAALKAGGAGDKKATFVTNSAGVLIDLGGADASGTLGLTDTELDRVTAGVLVVGDASSGAITISSAITLTDGPVVPVLELNTGADINGAFLVKVATADLNAVTGIGNTTPLSLASTSISADTTNGDIDINNATSATVTVPSLTTGTGTITFDQTGGGGVTITSAATVQGGIALSNTSGDLTLTNVSAGGIGSSVAATTTTSGDILVGLVTAGGDTNINAAESIRDNNGAANNIAAGALTLQATKGIGSGAALETQVTSVSAANSVSGNIELSNSGSLGVTLLDSVADAIITATGSVDLAAVAVAGKLTVTATEDITDSGSISVDQNANFDAGTGNITLGDAAGETINLGSLTFETTGAVAITEDDATTISGTNTAGMLVLTSAGAITDAASTSISVVNNAAFHAGLNNVTLGDNAGDTTNFGSLDADGGIVTISEDSSINLNTITATTVILNSGGSIIDNNAAGINIAAISAALNAAGGIGSTDALEMSVLNLAFKAGQGVQIANTGALAVASIGGLSTSSSTGAVALSATSPIVFGVNTTAKTLTAQAIESIIPAPAIDSITVNAGVTVSATAGDVTFEAGDRIIISATAKVTTSGNITFQSGMNDNDSDGSMTLNGTVSAGLAGTVTLNLNGQQGATEALGGSITGGGLLLLGTGAAGAFSLDASTTNNVATIAANVTAALAYRGKAGVSIGTVNATSGINTANSDATICLISGNLGVDQSVNVGAGMVRLQTLGGKISGAGAITANALGLRATGGGVTLTSTSSNVAVLAGVTTGSFSYMDADGFTLGTVTASGNFTPDVTSVTAGGDLELAVATGDLTIDGPLNSGGIVRLVANNGSIGQNAAIITAALGLGTFSSNGVSLTEANAVTGSLALSAPNGVAFRTTNSVTIDSVAAGVFFPATTGVTSSGLIDVSSDQVLTVSDDVTSTAAAGGTAINLRGDGGVSVNNGASVHNNQAQAVTINVTGTGGAGHADGIIVTGATIDSGGADITLIGTGGAGTPVSGIRVESNGIVQTSGAGKVLLTGVAPYTAGNSGVMITSGGRITAGGGNAARSLGLAPGSQINIELTSPGSFSDPFAPSPKTYDFVHVDGTVDLGFATLNATTTSTFASHTTFMVLRNDGQVDGNGTFPIDTTVPLRINSQDYFLSYSKGDGNDVTLERNSPPTPNAGGPYVIFEGNDLTLNASATTDVDSDQLTYLWTVNNVPFTTTKAVDTIPWVTLQDQYGVDDGKKVPTIFAVALDVTDNRYLRTATATSITLNNTPPTVQLFQPSQPTAVTAQTRAFLLTVTDPSHADTIASFTFAINWGDGSSSTFAPTKLVDPFGTSKTREGGQHEIDDHSGTRFVFDHAYDKVGTYTVTIVATDKDGGVSSQATTKITVNTVEIQQDGVLAIGGTPKNDQIAVINSTFTTLMVYMNGSAVAPTTSTRTRAATAIPLNKVTHIAMFGGAGDDRLVNFSSVAAEIHGGVGNDFCCGSRFSKTLIPNVPPNLLKSAFTSDVLFGDDGADYLHNFGGNNLIIAGDGSDGKTTRFATIKGVLESGVDQINVDGGNNIVIAGDLAAGPTRDTSYKGNPYNWTNLSRILQQWVLNSTFDPSILVDVKDTEKDLLIGGNNSVPHKGITDLFVVSLLNPVPLPAPPKPQDRIDAFVLVPAGKDDKLRILPAPI